MAKRRKKKGGGSYWTFFRTLPDRMKFDFAQRSHDDDTHSKYCEQTYSSRSSSSTLSAAHPFDLNKLIVILKGMLMLLYRFEACPLEDPLPHYHPDDQDDGCHVQIGDGQGVGVGVGGVDGEAVPGRRSSSSSSPDPRIRS